MTETSVIELVQEMLWMAVLVSAPLLLTALAVGLVIGILQAATQVNEMTLSFIPKLLVMVAVMFAFGSWMVKMMVDYTVNLFQSIPGMLG